MPFLTRSISLDSIYPPLGSLNFLLRYGIKLGSKVCTVIYRLNFTHPPSSQVTGAAVGVKPLQREREKLVDSDPEGWPLGPVFSFSTMEDVWFCFSFFFMLSPPSILPGTLGMPGEYFTAEQYYNPLS